MMKYIYILCTLLKRHRKNDLCNMLDKDKLEIYSNKRNKPTTKQKHEKLITLTKSNFLCTLFLGGNFNFVILFCNFLY